MWTCIDERYDNTGEPYATVLEFERMCRACFGEAPELEEQPLNEVVIDETGAIILRKVPPRVYAVDPKDAPLDGGAPDEWLIGHAPDERGARELAARHYAGTGSEMFTLHHGVCPETGDDAWFAY